MTQKRPVGSGTGMRSRNTQSKAGRPRQGVAAKELQAARRKKRQREVMRNRIIFGAICALVLAIVIFLVVKLFGAIIGSGRASDVSTLTFDKSGKVVFEEVTDFDTDTYSKSELKSYTKDLIKEFNDSYGSKAVTLNKIRFRGKQAYIKTTYTDAKAYSAFTSYDTYFGNYEGAVSEGYDFEEVFSVVADSKKSEGKTIDTETTFADSNVAIVKENCTVVVPGEITHVSEPSTEIIDSSTVNIKQADENSDATDLVYIIYTAK
ncbi:hypothetical protein SAMN02910298_00981 [Pseudobutyrivibrio sp. YE44]|uniref:hypothetical protein n=1 Tax=Pseudobutyrivibrio sp. YE44 TaxID=1520802 RepID=UPI00088265F5|nr:hypothetical protein [Pseudobutyrivibrio sp. YE44]SDB20755.1 hypothetical protein SAMN02910298_00981 [Pseudobutyrivibrio sp. YE44]